jgi:hypothetical protein
MDDLSKRIEEAQHSATSHDILRLLVASLKKIYPSDMFVPVEIRKAFFAAEDHLK